MLRRHCEAVGRDYDEIEKTVIGPLDPGPDGERVDDLITEMRRLAGLGITHYHGSVPETASLRRIEVLGRQVIPRWQGCKPPGGHGLPGDGSDQSDSLPSPGSRLDRGDGRSAAGQPRHVQRERLAIRSGTIPNGSSAYVSDTRW